MIAKWLGLIAIRLLGARRFNTSSGHTSLLQRGLAVANSKMFDPGAVLLGVAISTPILASFFQSVFDVNLAPPFAEIVRLYREIITPAIAFIQWPLSLLLDRFDLAVPQWFRDLHTFSFTLAGMEARALAWASKGAEQQTRRKSIITFLVQTSHHFVLGLTGWSFVRWAMTLLAARDFYRLAKARPEARQASENHQLFYLTYISKLQSAGLALATTALFFLANALTPMFGIT